MRLFVSVDLDELTAEVSEVQDLFSEADGLRFTDPAQTHVTLKFLGDTDEDQLAQLTTELRAAVTDSGVEPFRVEFAGLGVFPHLDYISVVWLGVREGSDELTTLHEAIEERATAMEFDPETHEFTPHVTLARMDHAGGKEMIQEVVTERDPTVGAMTVDAVCLTESTLTPDGPAYSTVERFELSGQ